MSASAGADRSSPRLSLATMLSPLQALDFPYSFSQAPTLPDPEHAPLRSGGRERTCGPKRMTPVHR
jgi:hypothetical protein